MHVLCLACTHNINFFKNLTSDTSYMLQKDADPFKRDTVVLLLQDMFEVVTCDMMVNEIWLVYSLR